VWTRSTGSRQNPVEDNETLGFTTAGNFFTRQMNTSFLWRILLQEVTQLIFSISLRCQWFDYQVEILWSLKSERSMPISQYSVLYYSLNNCDWSREWLLQELTNSFTENEITHLINVRYVRCKNATDYTSKIHGEGWWWRGRTGRGLGLCFLRRIGSAKRIFWSSGWKRRWGSQESRVTRHGW
jgi:hypothetical protein